MELTIKERIIVLGLLPKETNFATLKIVRGLETDIVGFSEAEVKQFSITADATSITWDAEAEKKAPMKDCVLGEKAGEIIETALTKMNDTNSLTKDHYSLCEKFL